MLKVKLQWQDILFIIAMICNIGALISTYGIIGELKAIMGSKAYFLEGNPVNSLLLKTPILQISMMVVFWVLVCFMYLSSRKYIKKKPSTQNMFKFNLFVMTLFFLLIIDFLNDFGIILKIFGI